MRVCVCCVLCSHEDGFGAHGEFGDCSGGDLVPIGEVLGALRMIFGCAEDDFWCSRDGFGCS